MQMMVRVKEARSKQIRSQGGRKEKGKGGKGDAASWDLQQTTRYTGRDCGCGCQDLRARMRPRLWSPAHHQQGQAGPRKSGSPSPQDTKLSGCSMTTLVDPSTTL